jgi:hypothetical protein
MKKKIKLNELREIIKQIIKEEMSPKYPKELIEFTRFANKKENRYNYDIDVSLKFAQQWGDIENFKIIVKAKPTPKYNKDNLMLEVIADTKNFKNMDEYIYYDVEFDKINLYKDSNILYTLSDNLPYNENDEVSIFFYYLFEEAVMEEVEIQWFKHAKDLADEARMERRLSDLEWYNDNPEKYEL